LRSALDHFKFGVLLAKEKRIKQRKAETYFSSNLSFRVLSAIASFTAERKHKKLVIRTFRARYQGSLALDCLEVMRIGTENMKETRLLKE